MSDDPSLWVGEASLRRADLAPDMDDFALRAQFTGFVGGAPDEVNIQIDRRAGKTWF